MAKSLSSIVTDKLLLFNFADVNELWAGKHLNVHVILTKIGPYKLFCWDIARIAPNLELESKGNFVIILCSQFKFHFLLHTFLNTIYYCNMFIYSVATYSKTSLNESS